MVGQTVCPRCGARDSFFKGYLADTCVCRVCQSQLDWREIPGCGPDCRAMQSSGSEEGGGTSSSKEDPTGGASRTGDTSASEQAATNGPGGEAPASGSDA